MEYLSKPEVVKYLEGYRSALVLEGKDGGIITAILKKIDTFYTYRPTLQAQWSRKGDTISCSRCGYKTLVYKNSQYCPNCGRLMANGKKL